MGRRELQILAVEAVVELSPPRLCGLQPQAQAVQA